MKFLIFTLILLVTTILNGLTQNQLSQKSTAGQKDIEFSVFNSGNSEIDGNPYVNKEWKPGSISFKSGSSTELDQINYNIFVNKISYKKNGVEFNPVSSYNITGFTIGKRHFIFDEIGNTGRKTMYEVLSEGEIRLLKKYITKIKPGQASNGIVRETNDRYNDEKEYYSKKEGAPVSQLKLKNKDLLVVFKDKEKGIRKYIEANKLKARKEEDLVLMFIQFNSMQE